MNNIIEAEEDLNEKFVEKIEKTISENKDRKSSPCPVETILNKFTDLVRHKHIDHTIYLESLNKFKGYSQYFDLIFLSNDLVFTDFKSELLTILKPEEQKMIMENREVGSKIYEVLEREMFEGQNRQFVRDVFNQYFNRVFE